jgi:TonB family protein
MTRVPLIVLVLAGIVSTAWSRDLVQKVAAQYPIRALDRGIEGWVEVSFSIRPDGSVFEPKVVAARPPGTFDKSALAAVAKWRYVPVDTEFEAASTVVTFSALSSGAARTPVMDQLTAAARAVQNGRPADAEKTIADIEDTGGLTLVELVALERVQAAIDYRASRFAVAAARFNRILEMFGDRMEPRAVTGILESLIPAHINAGNFAAADQAAARWLADGQQLSPPLDSTLATIRAALAEGRPIRVTPPP